MRKKNQERGAGRVRALVATCLATGLILAISFATGWRSQQAKFGDFLVRNAPKPLLPDGVILVGIDPSSLNLDQFSQEQIAGSPSLQAMKQGFPWSRAVYADAIERLIGAGARLVFLDVLMRGPREGDAELRKALEKYGDKVVLISTFAEDVSGAGQNIVRYQQPPEELTSSTKVHVGFANFWRDEDQVVRLAPFRLKQPGAEEAASSAPAVMLSLLAGKEKAAALPAEAAFIPGTQILHGSMRPLWMLFDPVAWSRDLKNGAVFRNKIVAIGDYYSDRHDEFQTPAGIMPGVALQISALAAAWQGAFYSMPGTFARGAGALFSALAALGLALVFRNIILRSLAYGTGIVLMIAGGIAALTWLHFQIPLLPMLAGFLTGGVATLVVDLIAEGRARHRARRMLERYVSPKLAREMLDKRDSFLESLGGSRREVTVLFADLRGFTTFAESVEPVDLIAELNDYLGRMTSIIFDAEGGVDKFLGDGILAVWGTLDEGDATPDSAPVLACSEKMLAELKNLNLTRVSESKTPWHLGIGIHRGPVVFGNVGSQTKMELTVIGDTVNLASRTEGLNKSYGTEVLFTETVRDYSGHPANTYRTVDRIRVMGRSRPVDLFTFWSSDFPPEDRAVYERALEDYRKGEFSAALVPFQTLQKNHPSDPLCRLYVERCMEWLAAPPHEAWDGVSQAKSK